MCLWLRICERKLVADSLVLYTAIHQPLPLRMPAIPMPLGAEPEDVERCIFDLRAAEEAFREVVGPTYGPALHELAVIAEEGTPLSVSVADGFLEMSGRWCRELIGPTGQLLRAPSVEPVVTDPKYGFLFAFDIGRFVEVMEEARARAVLFADRPIRSTEVSGFCINHELYHSVGRLGFAAIAAEGDAGVTRGRHPGHLVRFGEGPIVIHRMQWLSDEFDYRLRAGAYDPEKMADVAAGLPGEAALISFDFDSLAFAAGGPASGARFLSSLARACLARGVKPLTISEAAFGFAARAAEQAPPLATAMSGLSPEEARENGSVERAIFDRMLQAYEMARLAHRPEVLGICDWLLQRTNVSVPGMAADTEGRPLTYWRAGWWRSDRNYEDTAKQVLAAYDNFIQASSWYARGEIVT